MTMCRQPEAPEIDDEDEAGEQNAGKLEEVRMSNFAYSQTKISEYLSCYFAILSICSAGIATEMNYDTWNVDGNKEEWIKIMIIIGNVSTIPLSKLKIMY